MTALVRWWRKPRTVELFEQESPTRTRCKFTVTVLVYLLILFFTIQLSKPGSYGVPTGSKFWRFVCYVSPLFNLCIVIWLIQKNIASLRRTDREIEAFLPCGASEQEENTSIRQVGTTESSIKYTGRLSSTVNIIRQGFEENEDGMMP